MQHTKNNKGVLVYEEFNKSYLKEIKKIDHKI